MGRLADDDNQLSLRRRIPHYIVDFGDAQAGRVYNLGVLGAQLLVYGARDAVGADQAAGASVASGAAVSSAAAVSVAAVVPSSSAMLGVTPV